MTKPIWKGGRPKKIGPREKSGRPSRNAVVPPPAMEQDGLALSAADYAPREVTERGQVIGRTVARITPLDRLRIGTAGDELDGDEWKALAEYERRHAACEVSVKCHLNRTPGSGAGLDGVVDKLRVAIAARNRLRFALPPMVWAHVEAVFEGKAEPVMARMKTAAGKLLVALDNERRWA